MSKLLEIDIKILDDSGFKCFQTGLIQKVLEATGMEHYNGLPTPTKVRVNPSVTNRNRKYVDNIR